MSSFYVGLDLGQSRDFTAFAVVEWIRMKGRWDPASYSFQGTTSHELRHLERIPLGTSYPEIIVRMKSAIEKLGCEGNVELIVDATGVGRPVVDMLRAEDLDCTMRPVMVTGGQIESIDDGYYKVPKRDLIVGLQCLFQKHTLRIGYGLKFAADLMNEAMDMKATQSIGGQQFEAWREGTHDDLIFAVALACWGAERWSPRDPNGYRRLF